MNNALRKLAAPLARGKGVMTCGVLLVLSGCVTGESTFQDFDGEVFAGLPFEPTEAGPEGDLKSLTENGTFRFEADENELVELTARIEASSLLPPGDTLTFSVTTPAQANAVHGLNPAAALASSRASTLRNEEGLDAAAALRQASEELLSTLDFIVVDESAEEILRFDRASLAEGDTFRNRAMIALSLTIILAEDANKQVAAPAQQRLDAVQADFETDGSIDPELRDELIATLFVADLSALQNALAADYRLVGRAPFPDFTAVLDLDGDGRVDDFSAPRCGDGTLTDSEWADPPSLCGLSLRCEPEICEAPDGEDTCVTSTEELTLSKLVLQTAPALIDGSPVRVERTTTGVSIIDAEESTATGLPNTPFVVASVGTSGDTLFAPDAERAQLLRWDTGRGVSTLQLAGGSLPPGAIECLGAGDLNADRSDELATVVREDSAILYVGFFTADGSTATYEPVDIGDASTCQSVTQINEDTLLVATSDELVFVELLTGNRLTVAQRIDVSAGPPHQIHTRDGTTLLMVNNAPYQLVETAVGYELVQVTACVPADDTLLALVPMSSTWWAALTSTGVTLLERAGATTTLYQTLPLTNVLRIDGGNAPLNVVTAAPDGTTYLLRGFDLP